MIKAIIFDIDGVLLDSRKANIIFFQDLIEKTGYKRPSQRDVSKVFHMTMWDAIKTLSKEKSERRIKEIWVIGKNFGYPAELVKINPYSKEAVKTLSRKYRLALVTSETKEGVKTSLRVFGMRKYFEVIVSFEDFSRPKPHPEPLLVAIKRLKISPKEAIYVEDSKTDVRAAKAAGMKIISYSKKPLGDEDINIDSFKKLPAAINKLEV